VAKARFTVPLTEIPPPDPLKLLPEIVPVIITLGDEANSISSVKLVALFMVSVKQAPARLGSPTGTPACAEPMKKSKTLFLFSVGADVIGLTLALPNNTVISDVCA
jgi:hypothetical protein